MQEPEKHVTFKDMEGNATVASKNSARPESSPVTSGSFSTTSMMGMSLPYAVVLQNVKAKYGRFKNTNVVLNDCTMVVPKRKLFTLLGANSSGKTTLLMTIVGLKKVSEGEIWVLGGHPGSRYNKTAGPKIGYMPQELALFGDLTIRETLNFFGTIYGMHKIVWMDRAHKYFESLKLPNMDRPVRYLSGGQRRRLSFILAILHRPKVMILDEPCVGVDPLVRKKMWDLLKEFVAGGRTVITTTQNIEEANDATDVAFLYKGHIVAQDTPSNLKEKYQMKTMSDVFYKLTQDHDDTTIETNVDDQVDIPPLTYVKPPICRKLCPDCGYSRLRAMLFKNRIRYIRNWKLMLFLLILPIFQVVIFNITMGSTTSGLKMGVVNRELQNATERNELSSSYCPISSDCMITSPNSKKSCTFLSLLDQNIVPYEYFPDEESAQKAFEKGETYGTMKFDEDYTPSLKRFTMRTASDEDFNRSKLHVNLHNSNFEENRMLKSEIFSAYQRFREKLADECGQNRDAVQMPLVFLKAIYGSYETEMKEFVSPGALCVIVFFLSVSITSLDLLTDKTEGLLQRSYVAGVSFPEMIFSHTAIQFLIVCFQAVLVVIVHFGCFDNSCKGLYAELVLLLIFQGMVGAALGFFISALCSKEETAIELSLGLLFPIILLSGMFWSLEGMDPVPKFISERLPMSYAIVAGRSIITRGWSIMHWEVFRGLVVPFIWFSVFWILALVLIMLNFH